MPDKPKTKLVEIELAALTRVRWGATVEVPEDFDEATLNDMVEQFYQEIDEGEFYPDKHFWEQGNCYHSMHEPTDEPTYRVDQLMHIDMITAEPGTHCPVQDTVWICPECGQQTNVSLENLAEIGTPHCPADCEEVEMVPWEPKTKST